MSLLRNVAASCFEGLEQCFLAFGGPPPTPRRSRQCQKREPSINARLRKVVWAERPENSLALSTLLLHYDPSRSFTRSYKVVKQLGGGAFGTVYSARSTVTGEERAVKIISKSKVKQDMRLVMTEIEALIRLRHPHIVKFYEFFEDRGVIRVVMELCKCGDFLSLQGRQSEASEIRLLYRDVMMGVAYLHDSGIAHRDLKFENCLLCEGATRRIAKVIDFGLSAIRRDERQGDAWLRETCGTSFFLAPEVVSKTSRYGVQCDLWSLGVMLYILLTDEHPFAQDATKLSCTELMKKIQYAPVRPDPLETARVDPVARVLIEKLLVRDPNLRLDAKGALNEEWLRLSLSERALDSANCRASSKKLLKRLTTFSATTRFDKVVLTLVAHLAKLKELEETRATFVALDTQNAGFLSKEELRAGLSAMAPQLAEEDFEATFTALDTNQDQRVSYAEWLSATVEPSCVASDSAVKELFNYFDADGNGSVSRSELRRVVGEEEAERIFQGCDKADGELLSWDEFRQLVIQVAELRSQACS